jgi:phycobilisome rod-core linker protein
MPLPLLEYSPTSQNQRVKGFELGGDEQPRIFTTQNRLDDADLAMLIMAAYRQICNEQQMLSSNRQWFLESQLRAHQITVREFIQGLLLSDSFRRLTYESNDNYRFVEICIQRVLGRNVYSDREKMAWSIVLATKGLNGFVHDLLSGDEYLDSFGDHIVPYQRRRILPMQTTGEVTFAHMARYGSEHRDSLPQMGVWVEKGASKLNYYRWDWQKNPPAVLGQIGQGIIIAGVGVIGLMLIAALFGL